MTQRILVADDSITIQKVIGLTFANENFELEMADNGDEALEKALANRPDLVIADTNMPGLSGYDLCARMRVNQSLATVPLILLAGTYEVFDDERAREVGANDHLTKPFESQALIEKVRGLLAAAGGGDSDPVEEMEPELLDAEILEDDDVLAVEAEPETIETAAVEPAPAPVDDMDFGDVAVVEPDVVQDAPQQAAAQDAGWDMGGFADYTAGGPAAADSTDAAVAAEPDPEPVDAVEDFPEPASVESVEDYPEPELASADGGEDFPEPEFTADEFTTAEAAPAEELPAAGAPAPEWSAPVAEEADVAWDEPEVQEVQEIEPELATPAEVAVAEFAETADFDAPIAAPEPVAPAPDDLAWGDAMDAADVIADAAAEAEPEAPAAEFGREDVAAETDAADPFAQFAQAEAEPEPAAAPDDIEDVYAAFSAQAPAEESAAPATEESAWEAAAVETADAYELPAEDAAQDVVDDAVLESADHDGDDLPSYDAAGATDDLLGSAADEQAVVEDDAAASTQPDWSATAWQAEAHDADGEEEFVPASAAPVWKEDKAPAAPVTEAAPLDLSATSERLVDEARQQITDRLAASLGSELGPLVESKVTAALDDLLPRLIETRLKAAVDQALAQALDDLKRRLG
jgi:CheY-like chemotaxis protein